MRRSNARSTLCTVVSLLCLAGSAAAQGTTTSPNGDASADAQRLAPHAEDTAPPQVRILDGDSRVRDADLAKIVAADIPEGGIPLAGASSPSALISELGKAGLDEEVCDPITCNPVYQLPPPEVCGVPPQAGCIPGG